MARSNNRLFPLSLSLSIKLSVKELRAKKIELLVEREST